MNITIIGSGNVATILSRSIKQRGHTIDAIYSKTEVHCLALANEIGTQCITDINNIPLTSDIYIISVSDKSISEISDTMPFVGGVVVHTSGATDINVLSRHKHYGVIYPCQTFSKESVLQIEDTPLLIESRDATSRNILINFAQSLSDDVEELDSKQRAKLHVAAVIASNFTNHLLCLAHEYTERNNIPFKTLKKLVEQTITKAFTINPYDAQTGPARRNDIDTINRHLQLIDDNKLKELYQILSDSIKGTYNK